MKGFTKGKGKGKKFIPTGNKKGLTKDQITSKKTLPLSKKNEHGFVPEHVPSAFQFQSSTARLQGNKQPLGDKLGGATGIRGNDQLHPKGDWRKKETLDKNHGLEQLMGGGSDDEAYPIPDVTAHVTIGENEEEIKLKYFVHTLNMPELVGDEWTDDHPDEPFVGELMVVPDMKHWSDKVWKDLENETSMTKEEMMGDESIYFDMIREGRSIRLGDDDLDADEDVLVKRLKDKASGTSSLIGFFMDKPWNRIGSDGWDTLNHIVNDDDIFGRK